MKPAQITPASTPVTPNSSLKSALTTTAHIAYKLLKGWMVINAANSAWAAPSKETQLGNICVDSRITPVNNPGFEFASYKGDIAPKSCLLHGGESEQCQNDLQAHYDFKFDLETWDLMRKESKQAYDTWRLEYKPQVSELMEQFTGKERAAFKLVALGVNQWTSFHYIRDAANRYQKGACGEHTAIMILDILEQDLNQGTTTSIQEVIFQTSQRKYLKDHTFLLLNSDVPDIVIENDAQAVSAHFSSANNGRVCDAWNRVDTSLAESGTFYTNDEGNVWDSVKVKSVASVNSLKTCYDMLPSVGQSLIRQMCAGRELLLRAICGVPHVSPKMEL